MYTVFVPTTCNPGGGSYLQTVCRRHIYTRVGSPGVYQGGVYLSSFTLREARMGHIPSYLTLREARMGHIPSYFTFREARMGPILPYLTLREARMAHLSCPTVKRVVGRGWDYWPTVKREKKGSREPFPPLGNINSVACTYSIQ